MTNFRLWLARKLLNTASRLMGDYPMAHNAKRRWRFNLGSTTTGWRVATGARSTKGGHQKRLHQRT